MFIKTSLRVLLFVQTSQETVTAEWALFSASGADLRRVCGRLLI